MSYTNGLDKPTDYFNTVTYTGTNADQSITGVGFQPDFVWIKSRNTTYSHRLVDVVRGRTEVLFSNNTDATQTDSYGTIGSFDSDGVSFVQGTSNPSYAGTNDAYNYVMWNWLADNTSGSSNTDGSITSTVSASTTAGFSIVSYTGTGSNATVGHGLGSTPKILIVKNRDATQNWLVYSSILTGTSYLRLNLTNAKGTASAVWNNTDPTSSVFTVGTDGAVNGSSQNLIAYCFAEKKGYSKFGSYTANGSTDGTFVYTGFKPSFILIKGTAATRSWSITDNKRLSFNNGNKVLFPDSSGAEYSGYNMDLLSNGFKIRGTESSINYSGDTYIFMAFASEPFVTSTGIPTTAR